MKTHIISKLNIDQYLSDEDKSAFPTEKSFNEELDTVARRNVKLVPTLSVSVDDVAELTISGKTSKYNKKNLRITVGKNLYNKQLEEKIVGMKKGQTTIVNIDGEEVTVTVNEVLKKQLPLVTDEIIAEDGIAEATTVREYKEKFFAAQKDQTVTDIANSMLTKIIAASEFYIDDGEVEELIEQSMEHCRILSKKEGKVFEEMTSEELGLRVAAGSIEQFKCNCAKYYNNFLKISAISLQAIGRPAESFEVDSEAMHGLFKDFKDYVCRKIEEANK